MAEIPAFQQHHRQSISHRQGDRRACRRRQVQGAHLPLHCDIQNNIGLTCKFARQLSSHGDNRIAVPLQERKAAQQFIRAAAIADGNHDILGSYHAEVAVATLRRVYI